MRIWAARWRPKRRREKGALTQRAWRLLYDTPDSPVSTRCHEIDRGTLRECDRQGTCELGVIGVQCHAEQTFSALCEVRAQVVREPGCCIVFPAVRGHG